MAGGRFIVTADDLGLTTGINDGIFEAHASGIVTAASLMPTASAFEEAVSRLAAHPQLDVGIHLTLDEERPLLDGLSTVVDDHGRFLPRGELVRRLVLRRVDLREVERCWAAQIERVLDAGVAATFVNSHGHVHAFPSLLPLAARLAARYGIPAIRRPVARPQPGNPKDAARVLLVSASAGWSFRQLHGSGLRWPDRFVGLVESGKLSRGAIERLVRRPAAGVTELMAHPGRADDETRRRYGHWQYRWDDELVALTTTKMPSSSLTTFLAEFSAP